MRLIQTTGKLQTDSTAGASQTYNFGANLLPGSTVILSGVHWNLTAANKITAVTASGTSGVNDIRKTDAGGGATTNNAETWRVDNVAGGSTAIVITTASASYISMSAEEWRGFLVGTPLDKTGTTSDTTSSTPTVTASAALSSDYGLVYASFVDYVGANWTSSTPPSGGVETFEEPNGTAHEAGSAAYKLINNGTAGAPTMAFTTGASMSHDAALAAYLTYYPSHHLAMDFLGTSNTSITTGAVTTDASPGAILTFEGRGANSDFATATVSDNKGNGNYTALAASKTYTNWPTSGTQVKYKLSPTGGSGHTFTATKPTNTDELTLIAVEVPPGFSTIQDWKWNEDLTTSTNTSSSVTTTAPAWLYAFVSGDNVNGWTNPAPPSGWYKLEWTTSVASNHVQCAAFCKYVATPGTYNIVVTPDVAQGSQMWLVAMQQTSGTPAPAPTPAVDLSQYRRRRARGALGMSTDVREWW